MRKEFLSNVSHELKTPIALVQGYAEGLKECINDDPESREFYCSLLYTSGGTTDMESDLPICYIDKDRKTYLIAADFKEFLKNCKNWKSELKLCEEIEIFTSKEEANKKYTFILVADQFDKHATDD